MLKRYGPTQIMTSERCTFVVLKKKNPQKVKKSCLNVSDEANLECATPPHCESASHRERRSRLQHFSSPLEEMTVFSDVFQAFDSSIRKDEHLAVAFFQRGLTFYKMQRQDRKPVYIRMLYLPHLTVFKIKSNP